jgi:lipopolysaccharide/colanic/teichoic acid biosynthesis glycosyltransferase
MVEEILIPFWKRAFDLLLLVFLAPAILLSIVLISIYIKLVSRGPVFFRQERIGYLGKSFTMYKFRTLHRAASNVVHQQHLEDFITSNKTKQQLGTGAEESIPLGGLLRVTELNDLPQVINVLKGEMSIVGPRPSTPYELARFEPWHNERFRVLPGLTGLWQVCGRNKTTFEEMIKLDIFYVRNESLALDLKILVKTFPALVEQVKDYLKRQSVPAAPAV